MILYFISKIVEKTTSLVLIVNIVLLPGCSGNRAWHHGEVKVQGDDDPAPGAGLTDRGISAA